MSKQDILLQRLWNSLKAEGVIPSGWWGSGTGWGIFGQYPGKGDKGEEILLVVSQVLGESDE